MKSHHELVLLLFESEGTIQEGTQVGWRRQRVLNRQPARTQELQSCTHKELSFANKLNGLRVE